MTTVMPKALGALLKLFFLAGVPSSPPEELRRGVHALKMSWQEWNDKLVVRHTDAPVARAAVQAALDWFTTTQPPLAYPSAVAGAPLSSPPRGAVCTKDRATSTRPW